MSSNIQRIVNLLFQVDRVMHEYMRDAEAKAPLTLPETMVLSYLAKEEAASITDMAAHFGIRKSSMSTKIAKLERQGLISRDSCRFDKRSHSIILTPKAIKLLSQTKQYVADQTNPLFSKLSKTEQETFIQLLKQLIS